MSRYQRNSTIFAYRTNHTEDSAVAITAIMRIYMGFAVSCKATAANDLLYNVRADVSANVAALPVPGPPIPASENQAAERIGESGRIILSVTLCFLPACGPRNDGLFINDLSLSTRGRLRARTFLGSLALPSRNPGPILSSCLAGRRRALTFRTGPVRTFSRSSCGGRAPLRVETRGRPAASSTNGLRHDSSNLRGYLLDRAGTLLRGSSDHRVAPLFVASPSKLYGGRRSRNRRCASETIFFVHIFRRGRIIYLLGTNTYGKRINRKMNRK